MQQDATAPRAPRTGWQLGQFGDWPLVVGWVALVKCTLYFFLLTAVAALGNRSVPWREVFERWDAQRYLQLARDGYVATGEASSFLVGFPLYPWLVRMVSWSGLDFSWAGLFVSGAASIGAGWCLLQLVRIDQDVRTARLALWFLFIFPTSYFLHVAYSEATLLALALGCFLAGRRNYWMLCGMLGGLAALSRISGVLLLPAIAWEVWEQYRATGRWDWRWLWLASIPCGLGVYLWLNYHVTGDPLAFTKIMSEHFGRDLAWPWTGARNLWDNLFERKPEEFIMQGVSELFFTVLALGMTIWTWRALRVSYAVWMTGNFLLGLCTSFVVGQPRYALVMFPIFILLARASHERPALCAGVSLWSVLWLALFSIEFALGHWAF